MRTRVDSWEIAKLWARQSQEHARCSSAMSFNGTCFLSYSTVIGEIVETPSGEKVYFVSEERYSNTTARHLSDVRSAAHSCGKVIEVPGVSRGNTTGLGDFGRVFDSWQCDLISKVSAVCGARRVDSKMRLFSEANELLAKMRNLADIFDRKDLIPDSIEDAYGYIRWKSAVKRLEDGSPAILPDWNVFENLRLMAGSETEYKPKRRRRVQSGAPLFAQIAA